ncbi:TonB-dependent receptor [Telluribacter sp. SYSU D00476]|uniref:TonB-dependent receptor n=1 Tax=Telluribacter sp. SYSU D00476 TaxID=2811430 RepID=UPI001FF68CD2|nr:TonB-dependent receptor [Telluribacter sp. SYSU D00476]
MKKQTGVDFLYVSDDLKDTKPVTISLNNAPLVKILDACMEGQPLYYTIDNSTVLIRKKQTVQRQPEKQASAVEIIRTPVTGKVFDQEGGPLVGASVVVKNSKGIGTTTDASGSFSVQAEKGDVLVISFIGYVSKEVVVKEQDNLRVTLDVENNLLNDVIVLGYGSTTKQSIVSSVAQVSSAELKTAPTANLSSMLQGRLPGLVTRQSSGQPGSDGASLLVRGINTLSGSSPLVIVDGIEREFPNINPDEVETITVLKDAASAAVYGARAANGVILITTKKGTIQKPTITFNSSLGISSNTRFPEFLNGPEYAYWYNKAQEMDGVAENARRFTPEEINRINNGDPEGTFGNTDWFDLLFRKSAPIYINNLSLNGGSDKFKYFVSLGSYNQQGIIARTSNTRYNFRANIDAQVSENFKASFGLAARDETTEQPGLSAGLGNSYASIFSQAMMSYPFLRPFNSEGKPVGSFNTGNGNQNPLAARDLSGTHDTRSTAMQGNISLQYDFYFLEGLNVKVNGAYDKGYSMRKAAVLPYLLSVYNNANRTFTETYARHALNGNATINQWFADTWQTTLQPSINFNRTIGAHKVGGMLLYEYIRNSGTSMSAGRRGFPITEIMDLNYGEEVINDLVRGGHSMFHRAGYVSRLTYDYKGKYLAEFTGRYDGSTRLPSHTRWGLFPAVALGWRVSEEDFFKQNVGFVNDLKIRLSSGRLGNDAVGNYSYLRTLSMGANPVAIIGDRLVRSLSVSNVPNKDIKWETTTTYNAGFESTMWNGLLGVEADVFYNVTKDILQSQSGLMPPSIGGYFPQIVNSGIVDNRGFELILTHRRSLGDFYYNVRGNVSWARNRIIQTTENVNVPDYLRRTGQRIGMKYGFVADGLFQSEEEIANSALFGPSKVGEVKLKDLNGDGRITWDQDWTAIGRSSTPEMIFGMNVSAGYKAFDFNLFFQGAAITDVALSGLYASSGVYDNTFYTMAFYQDGNSPKYLAEGAWTPENPNALYPRLSTMSAQSGGKFSSWWIRDASYVRLKSAQIGYTLPPMLTRRLNIDNLRLHISGSNLFTWTGLEYLDPEMPDVNQGYYPQQKLFEAGLSLSF